MVNEEQGPEETTPQMFLPVQLVAVPASCVDCKRFWIHTLFAKMHVPNFQCPHCGNSITAKQETSLIWAN